MTTGHTACVSCHKPAKNWASRINKGLRALGWRPVLRVNGIQQPDIVLVQGPNTNLGGLVQAKRRRQRVR